MSGLVASFVNDPERDVDVLFRVLDTLRLYGYGEETEKLSIAAHHKLKDSTEILPWGLVELEELATSSFFWKCLNAGDAETDKIIRKLEGAGLHPRRESIDAMLGISRGFTREWTEKDFRKSGREFGFNLFLLTMEFVHQMEVKHSVGFITSDLFAWLLRDFYGHLSKERKGRFAFSFSMEHLSEYLAGYFGIIGIQQARGVALLPALKYFSHFLQDRKLVTPAELKELEKNVDGAKSQLRKICAKAPWRYMFLLQWKLDGKELYDEDHFSVDFFEGKKVGRNAPCPCGSGKKYKKCCGRWKK